MGYNWVKRLEFKQECYDALPVNLNWGTKVTLEYYSMLFLVPEATKRSRHLLQRPLTGGGVHSGVG